jgi:hypothetical protein
MNLSERVLKLEQELIELSKLKDIMEGQLSNLNDYRESKTKELNQLYEKLNYEKIH